MLKITDTEYYLPTVEALEAGRIFDSGRTRPMIIRGVCHETGAKGEYILKLKGSEQLWQGSMLNEILCAFIARQLDFFVPEPVVIQVSAEFVEIMQDHGNFEVARRSLGSNYGSILQSGFQELIPNQNMNAGLNQQLSELFAFDLFIANPDRRIDKPNFLSDGKKLLAIDHEMACSFLQVLPFARNPRPWEIPAGDMEWISKHFCFPFLKGNILDLNNFTGKLALLDDQFWQRAKQFIPEEWQNDHIDTIRTYLGMIVENRETFAAEINRILS